MSTAGALQLIDYALLACGALIVIAVATLATLHRRWAPLIALPEPPANRLEAVDVLFSLFCVFFFPPMVAQLFALAGIDAAPAATSQPVAMKLPQLVASSVGISLAIAGLLAIGSVRFDRGLAGWGLSLRQPGRRVMQAALAYLVAVPICSALLKGSTYLLEQLGQPLKRHATIVALLDPTTPRLVRIVAILNAVVLAAIAEELLFRGILQPALTKWSASPWTGLLVSSAIFGLIHQPYYDTIVPLTAFGIILGYLYARTGSLSLAILTHGLFNAKTILWLLMGATPE